MNTLVIVLIAAVCLFGAYTLYGRWLANKWGIDPTAKTPAVVHEDGRDYVPTNGWTVFAHQFSSIAGAGPVTGAIQAAAFGWLPVLLWVLLGGIFFGAVTDFGALYASVKNDGKSMGMLIEKYIGKTGRKLFLLFCWLFCGIVIAAFADMVAGTFNAFGADGALAETAQTNGAAGMVSIMFMVFAVVFGLIQKKFNFSGWKESVISIVFIVLSFVIGANLPLILGKAAWSYITFVYIFFAAVLPMWLLKQPRDHMTTFMFVAMIINRKTTHFKGFWRACFSMSIAVPQFVSLLVMHTMLQPQGAVNRMLQTWGWIDGPLPFFTNATWARVTVIIINLWVGIPYTIMQITGILQNIPADQYEAAKIDGANWWQIFTKITMPYIIFVLTPYLITTFTGNVNNFNVIYLLSSGDPTPLGDSAGSTDLLITWLYKLTVDKQDYNLGAVIGIMTFIVLAVVSLITYRNSGSYKNEEAFR